MRFITLKLEKMTLTLNSIAFAAESGYWLKVVVSEEVARVPVVLGVLRLGQVEAGAARLFLTRLREQHVLHVGPRV
jgi:hypothetical protein